jgi:hypothetical protein
MTGQFSRNRHFPHIPQSSFNSFHTIAEGHMVPLFRQGICAGRARLVDCRYRSSLNISDSFSGNYEDSSCYNLFIGGILICFKSSEISLSVLPRRLNPSRSSMTIVQPCIFGPQRSLVSIFTLFDQYCFLLSRISTSEIEGSIRSPTRRTVQIAIVSRSLNFDR